MRELEELGADASIHRGNVASAEDCQRTVQEVIDRHGRVDILAREAASNLQRSGKADPNGIGLTVNAVAPGFIETEMLETIPEKVLDKIRAQIPLGRLGRPEEVARVVHFLSADASSFITGQVWAVNGGQEM